MMSSASKHGTRFVLVAWRSLPAVFPEYGRAIGGLETGAWMLAQGLAARDDSEAVLCAEHTRSIRERESSGVRLNVYVNRWRKCRQQVSHCIDFSSGIRITNWSPSLLWNVPLLAVTKPFRAPDPRSMEPDPRLCDIGSDADVWCCFGVNADSARVVATAKSRKQPSILFLESNADLDSRFQNEDSFITKYGDRADECRFALREASHVVCQSQWQQRQLAERFGIDGTLIRNPILLEKWLPSKDRETEYVLWIGRFDSFHKRTMLAVEAARKCPDIKFVMLVNPHDAEVEREVRASVPPNVELRDYVPFSEMPALFSGARAFLSTSAADYEGFPNVLLQAAASHTPIVSLEDFDQFIVTAKAGVVANGMDELCENLYSAWQSPHRNSETREYLLKHHAFDEVAAQVAALGRSLAKAGSDGRSAS